MVAGVGILSLGSEEVLENINKYLKNWSWQTEKNEKYEKKPLKIFTPNPEIIILTKKDKKFKEIVNSAQINVPDGQGLIWASKFLKKPLPVRISGTDLAEKLVKLAAENGFSIGLIGGGPGVALKALECLQKKFPGVKGWAEAGPDVKVTDYQIEITNNYDIDQLVKKLEETKTQILFVGLGAPKQEYFIDKLQYLCSNIQFPLILMAVGGAFDYWSGKVPRAPRWIQNLGFEWLYRLVRQPWRVRRQLALLEFTRLILKEKFIPQN